MRHTLPRQVTVQPAKTPGYLTDAGALIFQRRGSSRSFEAIIGQHHLRIETIADRATHPAQSSCYRAIVTRSQRVGNAASISVTEDTQTAASFEDAVNTATAILNRCVGTRYTALPFVAGYCYSFGVTATDRFVSPVRYDAERDAVLDCQDHALITFANGSARRAINTSTVGPHPHSLIDNALRTGLHDCDFKHGEIHAKRRLAWLAGALILSHAAAPTVCDVLPSTLERESTASLCTA